MAENAEKSATPDENSAERSRDEIFKEYFFSLGKFIDIFAQVEKSMNFFLRYESQVNGDMAGALFRGFKVDGLKDAIKRVRSTNNLRDDPLMERAFTQLTHISSRRNDIVHFGAEFYDDDFFVTNALKAHNELSTRKFSASPDILDSMSSDLETMLCGLAVCILNAADRNLSLARTKDSIEAIAKLRLRADVPWRYIPPQPSPKQRQNPQTHPKRQRPPRASRR